MNRPLFQSLLPSWPLCASVACFGSISSLRGHGGVNKDRCSRRGGVCSEGWVRGQLHVSVCVALRFVVGCYSNLSVCQYRVVDSDMGGGAQIHCSEINNSS